MKAAMALTDPHVHKITSGAMFSSKHAPFHRYASPTGVHGHTYEPWRLDKQQLSPTQAEPNPGVLTRTTQVLCGHYVRLSQVPRGPQPCSSRVSPA